MASGDALIEHLLRRAGFSAGSDELATYSALSYTQAVNRLVYFDSVPDTVDANLGQPGFLGTTSQGQFSPDTLISDARQRWLFRMVHTERPLQEKMRLFWHNYFATAYSKVAGSVTGAGRRAVDEHPDQSVPHTARRETSAKSSWPSPRIRRC